MKRNIFDAMCSAWSIAPYLQGAAYKSITIGQYCKAIKNGQYAVDVEMSRHELKRAFEEAAGGNESAAKEHLQQYKQSKAKAPTAILQGTRQTWSRNAKMSSYTNVMCIDIDGAKPYENSDNSHVSDWNAVRDELSKIKYISFASLSVSGNGVFVLIPIADAANYGNYFAAFSRLLKQHYNLTADKSCKDVTRLRFMSYDANAYFNYDAEVWDVAMPVEQPQRTYKTQSFCRHDALTETDKTIIRGVVEQCKKRGIVLTDSYDDWMRISAFFAHFWNDSEGQYLCHTLARMSDKYNCRENEYKIANLSAYHPRAVGAGTFFHIAKTHGVDVRKAIQPIMPQWQREAIHREFNDLEYLDDADL